MSPALFRAIPVRLAASLALTVIIAYLSLVPGYPEEDDPALVQAVALVPSLLQNTMHCALYAVLTVLWAATLVRWKRPILWAACFAAGYGALLEYAQLFVPGRYPGLLDIGLNTLGVLIGSALAASLLDVRRRTA
jgi:VanZ family protein